jgi:hypothetical protein
MKNRVSITKSKWLMQYREICADSGKRTEHLNKDLSRMLCDLILTTDEACIYYCNLED